MPSKAKATFRASRAQLGYSPTFSRAREGPVRGRAARRFRNSPHLLAAQLLLKGHEAVEVGPQQPGQPGQQG